MNEGEEVTENPRLIRFGIDRLKLYPVFFHMLKIWVLMRYCGRYIPEPVSAEAVVFFFRGCISEPSA